MSGGNGPAAPTAHAYTYEETDRRAIATLYGLLAARAPSPVVELDRAVERQLLSRTAGECADVTSPDVA